MMFGHRGFQCLAVQHVEDFTLVGHLHGRCAGVGIARYNVQAQALCGNGKFLAQFAGAQKQYLFHFVRNVMVCMLKVRVRQSR